MQDKAQQMLWLRLLQWPGVSRRNLIKLLAKTAPEHLAASSAAQLQRFGLSEQAAAAKQALFAETERFEAQIEALQRERAEIIPITDDRYPPLLAEIPDPPAALFVAGDPSKLLTPQIAIVGGRKATKAGVDTAFAFAKDLASEGVSICSGLALGIDAASHAGALAAGGSTVAVIGTGIDLRYPRANQQLHAQIAEFGCVVSEYPPGYTVRRASFPQRNRIISGLSLGTLVVEASLRSGSLITARLALEQGREVYALPGSIHNPMAKGCNQLILQGATLVQTSADIIEELGGWSLQPVQQRFGENLALAEEVSSLTDQEMQLMALIPYSPSPVDILLVESGLGIAELQVLLTSLEMKGKIEQIQGAWQRCV